MPKSLCDSLTWLDAALWLTLFFILIESALAGEGGRSPAVDPPCCGGLMLCCPDDYCPKPLPCVPSPLLSCCPSDYCLKPLPWLRAPTLSCCGGDYCPKPLPGLCWLRSPVSYSCGK